MWVLEHPFLSRGSCSGSSTASEGAVQEAPTKPTRPSLLTAHTHYSVPSTHPGTEMTRNSALPLQKPCPREQEAVRTCQLELPCVEVEAIVYCNDKYPLCQGPAGTWPGLLLDIWFPVQAKIPEDYRAEDVSSATLVRTVGLGENVDSQRLRMTLDYLGQSIWLEMAHSSMADSKDS